MWPWFIVLAIIVVLYYVLSRKNTSGGIAKQSSRRNESAASVGGAIQSSGRSNSSGKGTAFTSPIPKGFQIFAPRLSVAGIQHRRDDALCFADDSDQTLALEPEPGNSHDPNAVKVIGIARGMRRFIGYVPKDVAEQIVGSGLADVVQARLDYISRSGNGFVDVTFQIVGPKDRKAHYDEFPTRKPASASQKECLKFFGLPTPKNLTSGQAEAVIIEHRKKLEGENNSLLDEWDAYEKISDEFDDADFRDNYELKKVSLTLLKQALDDLKRNGATMSDLANDIDKVVEKVIALRPDTKKY